jgi:hypothetical protein
MPKLDMPRPLMLIPIPTPPMPELASLSMLSTAGESYDIMLVLPVCGTLRGAGDEKVGRCFEGVLVEAVGVAMVARSSERSIARDLDWESFRDPIAG